jgi:O-acetyl-ADP-ribose deacetylase (regulator of RNase III)
MPRDEAKTCFVIMPYGVKTDALGAAIDFDRVHGEIIQPAIRGLDLDAVRSDEIGRAGSIHEQMFRYIATAAVAIVDITLFNPNVYYELGVRHALRPSVTVLIRRRGSAVPFNIQDQRVIDYEIDDAPEAVKRIRDFIVAGLTSVQPDSPIFSLLQDARKDWKTEQIAQLEEYPYRLRRRPGIGISILTGDLRERHGIDVWVNSENTNMQMSRLYDRSFSARVRYGGAVKDDNGEIVEDTIANELAALMKNRLAVSPGSVYVTSAGALTETHGVKRIFHAASVIGVPGSGYQSMRDVGQCVTNALRRMDDKRFAGEELRTIVFPMLGTGAGGASVDEAAVELIEAAIRYLLAAPDTRIRTVYFSAWNHRDVDACRAALAASEEIEPAA